MLLAEENERLRKQEEEEIRRRQEQEEARVTSEISRLDQELAKWNQVIAR